MAYAGHRLFWAFAGLPGVPMGPAEYGLLCPLAGLGMVRQYLLSALHWLGWFQLRMGWAGHRLGWAWVGLGMGWSGRFMGSAFNGLGMVCAGIGLVWSGHWLGFSCA